MKFVATLVLGLAIIGSARAIHPPMEPTPSNPGSPGTGGGTVVHTTGGGTTPTVSATPEPGSVTLALIGLFGGTAYRMTRRKS
jgi:hypothetical protein